MRLHEDVSALFKDCERIRRDLHKIPAVGFEEFKTSEYIKTELQKHSPDEIKQIAGTGVKAVYYAGDGAETIAFRADMDGLPIKELNNVPYKSVNRGKAHACGHDGHMTVLLLLANLINKNRNRLKKNIVLLFQPAEEGLGGSNFMIAGGALKDPEVSRIYGLHLWPDVPKGKIGVRWGPIMAQTVAFDIDVRGVSAHGASPQMGIDAVVSAAEFVSLMQTAISRNRDPYQGAVLTIGKIYGGTGRSIIADHVLMNATLRVFSQETYETLIGHIYNMAEGLSVATGAVFKIIELMSHPCVDNPRELVEDFYRYVHMEDIVLVDPAMASEDFSFYQGKTQGMFMFLGAGGGKNNAPLHNGHFDFDEDALLYGAEVFRRLSFGETYK